MRSAMNRLLHVDRDNEIINIDCATKEEVIGFHEGTGDAPALDPMRPFIDNSKGNAWNQELFELFIPYFEEEENVSLTSDDLDLVEGMFFDRLNRLGRVWRQHLKLTPTALEERRKLRGKRGRANVRRVGVRYSIPLNYPFIFTFF